MKEKLPPARGNGNIHLTLSELLTNYGPYWPKYAPPPDDETVFTQLDRFGEAVHFLNSPSARESAITIWTDHLRHAQSDHTAVRRGRVPGRYWLRDHHPFAGRWSGPGIGVGLPREPKSALAASGCTSGGRASASWRPGVS